MRGRQDMYPHFLAYTLRTNSTYIRLILQNIRTELVQRDCSCNDWTCNL